MAGNKTTYYYLGEEFPGVYFTKREVDCLWHLTRGHTIVSTAEALALSHRTVEFYVKNMRMKTGARNKGELLDKMRKMNFLERIQDTGISFEPPFVLDKDT